MSRERIGNLHLEGEDARCFVNSFFYPTELEIAEQNERRSKLYKEIDLKKTGNGYEAEMKDLDLSFLDEEVQEEQITMTIQMSIKERDTTFYGSESTNNSSKVVYSSENEKFTCFTVDEIMNWAA